jgi:hypothetical protein
MIQNLKMKNLNLLFAAALILLMYRTPAFLTDITISIFGRTALVIVLAYTLIYCEFSCSILFALIIIVLFHNTLEGFKEGLEITDMTDENKEGLDEEDNKDEDYKDEDYEDEDYEDEEGEGGGEDDKEAFEEEGKEGFLGINMISKKVMNKNFVSNLRNSLTNNLTDLDRFLKTRSEKNTIGATKQ